MVNVLAGSNMSHLGASGRKAMTHTDRSAILMGHVSTSDLWLINLVKNK